MAGFLSRLKARDGLRKKKNGVQDPANTGPLKPKWDDAYTRTSVEPEEVHELLHFCTAELKARGLDIPFFLLPYRPTSDPSAVRTFIRHFHDGSYGLKGETLSQDLRMTEPMVIAGVLKWCWSRLPGGVVGWDAYELFKIGEGDSRMARDSFKTFIPLSVESGSRQRIIFDFFELIAAVAAHGKSNGFGGLQLARMAAWWAFEQQDTGGGFDAGYKAWEKAADATTHLFFAYLRSLTPEEGLTGITLLPRSLEKLLNEMAYPPLRPTSLASRTNKLVMLVDSVSPTPFALLRRAGHFQYRDSDPALQEFSEFADPVQALTEECLRVLRAISAANESQVSSVKHSTSLRDASWSRFEDIGFSGTVEEEAQMEDSQVLSPRTQQAPALRSTPASGTSAGRPTTPSWADFLSSGFVAEGQAPSNLLLPPDKILPPLQTQVRHHSSQSHRPRLECNTVELQPAELASITELLLDHAFWWVWMNSLAPEETPVRKSAFGRCAIIETKVTGGSWLVMEEMIASAAPEQDEGAYIAEKKGLFSWTRRGRSMVRRKSLGKHGVEHDDKNEVNNARSSKTSIGPDTQAKILAKAAQMRALQENEQRENLMGTRRGRLDDSAAEKTTSVLTLQPQIVGEASSAMKWVKKYDKGTIKDAYMANSSAGRGVAMPPSPPSAPHVDSGTTSVADDHGNGHVGDQKPAVPVKDDMPPTPSTITIKPLANSPREPERYEQPPATPEKPKDTASQATNEDPTFKGDDAPTWSPKEDADAPAAAPAAAPVAAESQWPPPGADVGNSGQAPAELIKDKKGFRSLLRLKHRSSKIPDNAATDLPNLLHKKNIAAAAALADGHGDDHDDEYAHPQAVPDVAVSSPAPEKNAPGATHVTTQGLPVASEVVVTTPEVALETSPAPVENTQPSHEALVGEDLAPVYTQGVAGARDEFSRFDQGPLTEQPAFAADDDIDDEDDATPPPISRLPIARKDEEGSGRSAEPIERLNRTAGPGVQDRWAQIRKNAAQRAAMRQRDEPARLSQASGEDDDTSVEETIESRVARIKARVAELTGNMETSNGSQQTVTGRS
ncbi:hypothetical protein E4U42_001556 [Claviceps africana]|uniref:Meiotically up-regulated protein Msb1/Mug8 domain-containing protein n=1 Tax=Claviceps africana TaxID=83212 RepID=A0A8K0J9D2_9HYPO|nr:hypothetical protein E4U42_001556 [Claviceps africana]